MLTSRVNKHGDTVTYYVNTPTVYFAGQFCYWYDFSVNNEIRFLQYIYHEYFHEDSVEIRSSNRNEIFKSTTVRFNWREILQRFNCMRCVSKLSWRLLRVW